MTFKRRRFKNYTLKTKLLLTYIIITIIPTALLGYVAYSQYVLSVERQVGTYIPRLLNQANNNMERQIEQYFDEMNQINNNKEVMNILRKSTYQNVSNMKQDEHVVENYLASSFMQGSREHIISVFVSSKDRLFQNSRLSYDSGFSTSQSIGLYGNSFKLKEEERVFFPHETSLFFKEGKPFVLLVKQIIDYENRHNLGTVFVALDLAFIEQTIRTVDEQDDAKMWMIDDRGYIIYHSIPSLIGTLDKDKVDYPIANGSFQSDQTLYSSANSVKNRWTFMHAIPVSHLTEESDFVRNITIISFFIIVVLAIGSSIVLAWGVAKPIQRLAGEMKRAEKGDFDIQLTNESNDEVGMLSKAFTKMLREIEELINEKYEIELKQKEAELYALQSQINPHFMYNTLENIAIMVEEDEKTNVVEMVTNLGRMLHYSLGNKDQFVPLYLELQHIQDYLVIQKARFEETLAYSVVAAHTLHDKMTPKFILQPLIENAFEHAYIPGQTLEINVTVTEEENVMQLVIQDNGKGISTEKLTLIKQQLTDNQIFKKDDSFGLSNVNGRLVLHFGNEYHLRIQSEEGIGTKIFMHIPILDRGSVYNHDREN
ncbi:hypothetical protein BK128_07350 [Viridibacillus sp. FSL H7-0596]|uniref:sensor histidine kinase n=1 Tax=Viridibacillus sp. FSL H7-0596 TaxID=1928923 RepID=UPI00096CF21A|nr:sensor histidine kinase [Viridibacillus sp. FSL H7-0596]OMC87245.1 hypothetical protein BK128_07350 [Viridibacillus sp. FSL H7-0596]